MPGPVRVFPQRELTDDANPTPGMHRQRAFEAEGLWTGLVHTEPGASSGWHHHGSYQTCLYLVAGRIRLDFGPGGGQRAEAEAGQFVHIPAHAVHRESNPGGERATAVIARAGTGIPTVNVAGPEPN